MVWGWLEGRVFVRFVAFVNEEPPWFQTEEMGSLVYARRVKKQGERIVAMLALETIGCYSDLPKSQHYPAPFSLFYPDTGNFIAFVGNMDNAPWVKQLLTAFRRHAQFPSEGAALWEWIPGVAWSDHWSFWKEGYPAVMITDTAPNRYPYYHTGADTPDKVDIPNVCMAAKAILGAVLRVGDPAPPDLPRRGPVQHDAETWSVGPASTDGPACGGLDPDSRARAASHRRGACERGCEAAGCAREAAGILYVKIQGTDCQVREVILETEQHN